MSLATLTPTLSLEGRGSGRITAALPAALLWWLLPPLHPLLQALLVVGLYGAAYLLLAAWRRLPEIAIVTDRLARLRRRQRSTQ